MEDVKGSFTPWRVMVVVCGLIALTFYTNHEGSPEHRGGCLLLAVVAVNISGLLPVYCSALLVPVLATVLRVLPARTPAETARACFGSMMNPLSALIIGSFTMNSIFIKCRLDQRFLNYVAVRCGHRPQLFFFALLLGCMLCSSFVIITLAAFAAVRPLCKADEGDSGKALLIGVGISCTLGSVLTPISGTASLITLSVLGEFGYNIYFLEWMLVSIPICTALCSLTAAVLLRLYGTPPTLTKTEPVPPVSSGDYWLISIAALFVVGCIAAPWLEPVIGDPGNWGLLLTALAFGSGFLHIKEFREMPWDILAVLMGVNVLSFVLRESGFARLLAHIVAPGQLYGGMLWMQFAQFTAGAAVLASCAGQALAAAMLLPVVVAVGIKLYCPVLFALLVCMAICFGVCTPYSSQDLIMLVDSTDPLGRPLARRPDFIRVGCIVTFLGWLLTMSGGYGLGLLVIGVPPVQIIVQEPKGLVPSIELLKDNEEDTELRYLDPEAYLRKKLREVDPNSRYALERETGEKEPEGTALKDELEGGGKQLGPGAVPDDAEQVVGGGTVGPPETPKLASDTAEETEASEPEATEAPSQPHQASETAAEAESRGSLLHAERKHHESHVHRVVHHLRHTHRSVRPG